MASTSLHVTLPEALEAYVAERVKAGGFSDPGDYVRALIREDQERKARVDTLRRDLQVGLDELERGEGIPAEEVFGRLREHCGSDA